MYHLPELRLPSSAHPTDIHAKVSNNKASYPTNRTNFGTGGTERTEKKTTSNRLHQCHLPFTL